MLRTQTTSPAISAPSAGQVTAHGGALGANVAQDGGSAVTERGIVYAPTAAQADLAIGAAGVAKVAASAGGAGVFTTSVASLVELTDYTFRAYATNANGSTYTNAASFTTPPDFLGAADAFTSTAGDTRILPLANDHSPTGAPLALLSVSNPAIRIDGRALVVPAGLTGEFTYIFTDGALIGLGAFTVSAGPSAPSPLAWAGLLYDDIGRIAGEVTAEQVRSVAYFLVQVGAHGVRLRAPALAIAARETPLGAFASTLDADGRLAVSLTSSAGGSALSGRLRPAVRAAAAHRYNVALSGADRALVPGGGFLSAHLTAQGNLTYRGKLPDGRAISGGFRLLDNRSFVAYSVTPATPPGIVAGEFTLAGLSTTDVTGELAWTLPRQPAGLHAAGLAATLAGEGCACDAGAILPAGGVALTLSGGNLEPPLAAQSTSVRGRVSATANLLSWTPLPAQGAFTASLRLPGRAHPVPGAGIYLPKSNTAWGYFPGTTVGGRIELKPQ